MNVERQHSLIQMPPIHINMMTSKSLLNEVDLTNVYDKVPMLSLVWKGPLCM